MILCFSTVQIVSVTFWARVNKKKAKNRYILIFIKELFGPCFYFPPVLHSLYTSCSLLGGLPFSSTLTISPSMVVNCFCTPFLLRSDRGFNLVSGFVKTGFHEYNLFQTCSMLQMFDRKVS